MAALSGWLYTFTSHVYWLLQSCGAASQTSSPPPMMGRLSAAEIRLLILKGQNWIIILWMKLPSVVFLYSFYYLLRQSLAAIEQVFI